MGSLIVLKELVVTVKRYKTVMSSISKSDCWEWERALWNEAQGKLIRGSELTKQQRKKGLQRERDSFKKK